MVSFPLICRYQTEPGSGITDNSCPGFPAVVTPPPSPFASTGAWGRCRRSLSVVRFACRGRAVVASGIVLSVSAFTPAGVRSRGDCPKTGPDVQFRDLRVEVEL